MNPSQAHRRPGTRRLSAAALALALVVLVTGCSGSHEAHQMSGMPSAMTGTSSGSGDVMFAQMMIPHHEQAVVMADLAPTRAASPVIKDLAAEIKAAQQPEIDQMSAWLEEWGVPVMDADEAMSAHGGHGMAGMLTPAQLDELAASSGPQFDRLFAEYMILHHEGAIDMAQDVVDSSDPRVASLASAIITTQDAEIGALQAFLAGSSD